MLNKDFSDRIEELKHTTYSRMNELQTDITPMIKDVYLNWQFEYWYDGQKYNLWEDDKHLYAVNELPFCYDNNIKNTVFIDTLDNLINNEVIWPMLLFVNNRVIQWSDIKVIKDYDYTYIMIKEIVENFSISSKIIYFPIPVKKIRYGEDNDYLTGNNIKGLYFDTEGKLLKSPEFNDLSVRFEMLVDEMYFKKIDISEVKNGVIEFKDLDVGFVPTRKNVIMFDTDGCLCNHDQEWMGNDLSIIESDDLYGSYGMLRMYKTTDHDNRNIKTLLLIYNTAHSKSSSHLYIRNEDLNKESLQKHLIEMDKTNHATEYADYVYSTVEPFDFEFKEISSYDTNITTAASYITKYDFSLWNKVFIDNSPIKSFQYTGLEFKKMADDTSYVHWSRRHTNLIEDVAIMFVNSKIYANHIDIYYSNNTINLPTFGILDDDHVEIVLFTKCNNNILDIVVENGVPLYITPEYNLNDCYIMSEDHPELYYEDTPESSEHRRQYIVDIKRWVRDNDYNYTIEFENPEFYNKRMKIVPKNQFRYYRFRYKQSQFKFILPTIFNYCHDMDRYMIFVNGKKIDKTEYTITVMNKYRPFDKLVLYLSTILDKDDTIDVFYLPELLVEKYKTEQLTSRGYLYLAEPDDYPKLYSLSKYTTMVFVNGLKVNPKDIKDVDMNAMIVNTGLNNIHNVTIMEFMSGAVEVAKYLIGMMGTTGLKGDLAYEPGERNTKDLYDIEGTIYSTDGTPTSGSSSLGYEDLNFNGKELRDNWKTIINTIISNENYGGNQGYDTLMKYYGNLDEFKEVEKNYKDDYANLRSILYDIVADYYLGREGATTGSPFIYDFEMDYWYPMINFDDLEDGWTYFVDNEDRFYSSDGVETLYVQTFNGRLQIKCITLYPDHDKLLDYHINDNIATTDDVYEGKKFMEL